MTPSIIPGTEAKDVGDWKMLVDMMSVHILGRSVDICFYLSRIPMSRFEFVRLAAGHVGGRAGEMRMGGGC